jgi:Mitochondrial carrier protein
MTSGNDSHNQSTSAVVATSAHVTTGKVGARLIGSTVAGISELILFHPVDTIAKRLMTNETRLVVAGSASASVSNINQAIFRDAAGGSIPMKVGSLFPGIGFGATYKILQRIYKFGGQPVVRDWMTKRYGHDFDSSFGTKLGKTILSATAGSLIGIGEVILLPLDALKIKAQTAPEQLKGRGVLEIFAKEGFGLYRGAGWTIARNAPGSFALFGGNAACKSFMGLNESQPATWTQDAIASCVGATASIAIAQPLDVIKTRVQHRPFNSPESGASIIVNLVQKEGIGAFFKGLVPKILVVGPKLVFSFTIAQHTIAYFTNKVDM